MIELSEEMLQVIRQQQRIPIRVVNPTSQEVFVLLRADDFERDYEYDASPWTPEEMELLHEEAVRMADNFGKKPC